MLEPDNEPAPRDPTKMPLQFQTTSWEDIDKARKSGKPGAEDAMERLCARYRPLLVEYLRLFRRLPDEPEDLVQGFFLDFLERDAIQHADRKRGLFRSLILSSLRNYVKKEWAKVIAKKRGGGVEHVEWNEEIFSGPELETTDRAFDRRLGQELLERATRALREVYAEKALPTTFEEMVKYASNEAAKETPTELARRMDIRPNTIHKCISEFRKDRRAILMLCFAEMLGPDDPENSELRYLVSLCGAEF